jgi:hypothetical protein
MVRIAGAIDDIKKQVDEMTIRRDRYELVEGLASYLFREF